MIDKAPPPVHAQADTISYTKLTKAGEKSPRRTLGIEITTEESKVKLGSDKHVAKYLGTTEFVHISRIHSSTQAINQALDIVQDDIAKNGSLDALDIYSKDITIEEFLGYFKDRVADGSIKFSGRLQIIGPDITKASAEQLQEIQDRATALNIEISFAVGGVTTSTKGELQGNKIDFFAAPPESISDQFSPPKKTVVLTGKAPGKFIDILKQTFGDAFGRERPNVGRHFPGEW